MSASIPALADYTRSAVAAWNTLVTSVYKLVGFLVLSLILLGLVCYFGLTIFYFVSEIWVAPVILSPHHERVLEIGAHELQQLNQRDKLEAERLSLLSQVEAAERQIALSLSFQRSFRETLVQELAALEEGLDRTAELSRRLGDSRRALIEANREFSSVVDDTLDAQFEANLLDRTSYLRAKREIGAAARAELGLHDTEVRVISSVRRSEQDIGAMQTALESAADASADEAYGGGSLDVLLKERDYERSLLETAQLRRERADSLEAIRLLEASIERHDRLLGEIADSPYRRALDDRVVLAFVPYENLANMRQGEELYGCSLGLLWCRRVGAVRGVVDGEVSAKHPLSNELLRGLMIEIDLEDPSWAREKALYAGRAPLLI